MKFKAKKILIDKACRRKIKIKELELKERKLALVEKHSKTSGLWIWRVEGATNYEEAYDRERKIYRYCYGIGDIYRIHDIKDDIKHMKSLIDICALKTIEDGILLDMHDVNRLGIKNAFKKDEE